MSPLFGRNTAQGPTEEERQAAAVDLERIRQGGIPLGAEERLKRLAITGTPFFTSDLSAKEYALAQASGLQPVAQVMGSSIVKHGWVTGNVGYFSSGRVAGLEEPWNLARHRAFDRLRQEAQLAGADGVIGIEMSVGGSLGEADNVEYVVIGTAVRETQLKHGHPGHLGMCALSGQDVDKLRRIGAEVCAVVGHTTVLGVELYGNSNYALNSSGLFGGSAARNFEMIEITQAVYQARQLAMSEVERQARGAHADNIVISTLRHTIEHREYERNSVKYHYFYVTMHVLGTAIRLGAHPPHPAPVRELKMTIDLRH